MFSLILAAYKKISPQIYLILIMKNKRNQIVSRAFLNFTKISRLVYKNA